MPMTIRTASGHVIRTDNARAIKLIEAGAQQVDDEPDMGIEVATADAEMVETTEAPKPAVKKRAPKKAAAKKTVD